MLLFILAAAAGLFAGSYTYFMANPTPHRVPTAVVGSYTSPTGQRFIGGMEKALDASLKLQVYETNAQARRAVNQQKVFAIVHVRSSEVQLDCPGRPAPRSRRCSWSPRPRWRRRPVSRSG